MLSDRGNLKVSSINRKMDKWVLVIVAFGLAGFVSCQYDRPGGGGGGGGYRPNPQYNQPPASILLHKQALGQDGSFNYAFAADNGLQQGEIINPDGSRKGSYSYVDPNGKTISLSYTAGKDGFRVVNGDHLPKAPEPQQQLQQPRPQPHYYHQQPLRPNPQYVQHQEPPHYPAPYRNNGIPYETYKNAPNAPVYRGNGIPYEEAYRHGHPPLLPPPNAVVPYRANPQQYEGPYRQQPRPYVRPMPHPHPNQYRVQEGNYDKPAPYLAQQYQGHVRPEEQQKPHSFGEGFAFEFSGK